MTRKNAFGINPFQLDKAWVIREYGWGGGTSHEMEYIKTKRTLAEEQKEKYLARLNAPLRDVLERIVKLSSEEDPQTAIYAYGSSLITPSYRDVDLLFLKPKKIITGIEAVIASRREKARFNGRIEIVPKVRSSRPHILEKVCPWLALTKKRGDKVKGSLRSVSHIMCSVGDYNSVEFEIDCKGIPTPLHITLTSTPRVLERIVMYEQTQRKRRYYIPRYAEGYEDRERELMRELNKPLGSALYIPRRSKKTK